MILLFVDRREWLTVATKKRKMYVNSIKTVIMNVLDIVTVIFEQGWVEYNN